MSFHSWLQNLRSALAPGRGQRHGRRRGTLRAATHRPNLEVLEDRTLPSFSAPVGYAAGAYPHGVLTADFNGDGKLDLVSATLQASSLTVSGFPSSITAGTALSFTITAKNSDGTTASVTITDPISAEWTERNKK